MSRTKGQSRHAQRQRLIESRCPTHGLYLGQVSRWLANAHGRPYTIVGCPRSDCDFIGKAYESGGPAYRLTPSKQLFLFEEYPEIRGYLSSLQRIYDEQQRIQL